MDIFHIISFIIGGLFGMFSISLCVISKRADEQTHELIKNHYTDKKENNNPEQLELF